MAARGVQSVKAYKKIGGHLYEYVDVVGQRHPALH
jgi:hypothetical protein